MSRITIVGLGPAGLDRIPSDLRRTLEDPETRLLVRTRHHPASVDLEGLRDVEFGDRFYDAEDFNAVYRGLAQWVIDAAVDGDVVYAVPGSPLIAERSVDGVRRLARERDLTFEVRSAESFLDLVLDRMELDPMERGLQILDARELPDPLPLHLPTVIAQLDRPLVVDELAAVLARTLPDDTKVTVMVDLGLPGEHVQEVALEDLPAIAAGPRASLFVDVPPTGWYGLVLTNRVLREQCPWDREQTHHSLVKHLIEEAYETVEAISGLASDAPGGEPDFVAYTEVEEELGDLLLQVVFHATMAAEVGAFDVEEVAETIRRKLVRRHPHVFGDVEVHEADEVLANWERNKQEEKQRDSLMDDVPASLPALARAAKFQSRAASVGFDWSRPEPVLDKIREEVGELQVDLGDPLRSAHELGDLLFAVVNLARHLHVDPELALRQAADRFEHRFRHMEGQGPLEGLTLDELDERWERAKAAE